MHTPTRIALAAAFSLLVTPTADALTSLFRPRDHFAQLIMSCDAVVVGRITNHEPEPRVGGTRWSNIEVMHILFGVPATPTLRLRWHASSWVTEEGHKMTIACGEGVQLDRHGHEATLWLLHHDRDGEFMPDSQSMKIADVSVEVLSDSIDSLNDRLADYPARPVDNDLRNDRQRLLAVRNYLGDLLARRTMASNKGLQLTVPLVTPLVPSAAPTPLRGRAAAEPQRR